MKRIITPNDARLNQLWEVNQMKYEPCSSNPDEEGTIFCLNDDFGLKMNPAKASSKFTNMILDRMMANHSPNNVDLISIEGKRDSIIHFLSLCMDQYLRYMTSNLLQNEDDNFLWTRRIKYPVSAGAY